MLYKFPKRPEPTKANVSVKIQDLLHSKSKGFTEEHVEYIRENVHPFLEVHYPNLFGEDIPKGLRFKGYVILEFDADGITNIVDEQKFRAGSFNEVAYKDIKNSIWSYGFKWKYPLPAIFFDAKNQKYGPIITGNTRCKALISLGVKNCIFAVYEADDGYTEDEVYDAVSRAGILFNSIHDRAERMSVHDVKRSATDAVNRWKVNSDVGCAPTYDGVRAYVYQVCGEGQFTETKKEEIIHEVINNLEENPLNKVISWTAKARLLGPFLVDNNLIETNEVLYIPVACSTWTKSIGLALHKARKNKKQVRLVLHTSTLTGYDLKHTYESTLSRFVKEFESFIDDANVSDMSFFRKDFYKKVIIYGAFPALGNVHDLDKIVKYDAKKGVFHQKSRKYVLDTDKYITSENDESDDS